MVSIYIKYDVLERRIVLPALQVFKREDYGLLIGEQSSKDFIVIDAVQGIAKRKFNQLIVNIKKERKLKKILEELLENEEIFGNNEIIGDYHSHTEYGNIKGRINLSKEDKKFTGYPNFISLIIAINKSKIKRRYREHHNIISYSINGYAIDIGGYYYKNGRFLKAHTTLMPENKS